jgi:hypothetical protein
MAIMGGRRCCCRATFRSFPLPLPFVVSSTLLACFPPRPSDPSSPTSSLHNTPRTPVPPLPRCKLVTYNPASNTITRTDDHHLYIIMPPRRPPPLPKSLFTNDGPLAPGERRIRIVGLTIPFQTTCLSLTRTRPSRRYCSHRSRAIKPAPWQNR